MSLPRWDFLDEPTVRGIKAVLRRFKQDVEKQAGEIRRNFRRYQADLRRYQKSLDAWEKRLDDPDIDDPGPEPEEPARPDFDETMDEREAERVSSLAIFKEVLTAAQYKVVEKCTTAELVQARAAWDEASSIPLGELLASPTSSTETTEGPSAPISSTADGPSETSVPGSPGETSETS
ncbi:hypothetical protein A5720_28190 [Mycolicibacterium conceptionense]|uniref:Uncharacterized protein n=1 Tax=Mycolicibacterium conceptionense TaxID=451644 RepID=A0A1A1YK78_9MYCO|nr:hypothetical protein A5726_24855 [Mycolicibacterium conceptionense]OBF31713.1 hypothetical protein A5720_28190 [Mycolicibacterium conceptionense]OBH97013.1 hypothetical protein A5716_16735 [Mycolicibacterium conceptionense]